MHGIDESRKCFKRQISDKKVLNKKRTILTILTDQEIKLLKCDTETLTNEFLPKSWHPSFSHKHVQYVTENRSENMATGPNSGVPFELNYSSDESHTDEAEISQLDNSDTEESEKFPLDEIVGDESEDFLLDNYFKNLDDCNIFEEQNQISVKTIPDAANNSYDIRLPFSLGDEIHDTKKTLDDINGDSEGSFFVIQTRKQINSIKNIAHYSALHKDIINRSLNVREKENLPHLSIAQEYICYKANLHHDLIFDNLTDDDIFTCSFLPAMTEIGVTLIIDPNPNIFEQHLQQIKCMRKGTSILDVIYLNPMQRKERPQRKIGYLLYQILEQELRKSVIIFATSNQILKNDTRSHITRIMNLNMLKRIIFYHTKSQNVVKVCTMFPMVPYTLIEQNNNKIIFDTLNTNKMKLRGKPLLFSSSARSVGYYIERKENCNQVNE